MDYTSVLYPLGYPLELTTNSPDVLRTARESWDQYTQLFSADSIRLHICVGTQKHISKKGSAAYEWANNILKISSADGSMATCHMADGYGSAMLTTAAIENTDWLRNFFIETMAYCILDAVAFTPVHCACVSLEGRGVLLAGDSGAGKSSLAYACARRGWTYVSDDASHIVRGRKLVTGLHRQIRFREAALNLFPELSRFPVKMRLNGKMGMEIRTADLKEIHTTGQTGVHAIVFLNRGGGEAQLRPFPNEHVPERLTSLLTFTDGEILKSQRDSLRDLVSLNAFELRYEDCDPAVDELSRMVQGI